MAERDSNGFMWFVAGLGLGALVGVLYAPRSGRETREAIRQRAEEGRDFVNTRGREMRDRVNQTMDRGREILGQQREQFRTAYEAGRQAFREATRENPGATAGTPPAPTETPR